MTKSKVSSAGKNQLSTHSLNAFIKGICDVMRRSNCASALQYVPELTWMLFLRIVDSQDSRALELSAALGRDDFSSTLPSPYRWQDWASPYDETRDSAVTPEGKHIGWKRKQLFEEGTDCFMKFVNGDLLTFLHGLDGNESATPRQRIIGRIMTSVEKVRVDNEANFCDILDMIDKIDIDKVDDTHIFTLSQVYEDLLLKMGEKNSDGGQFFTPREVIRAMVCTVDPEPNQSVYDPCCGTGGFLAVAHEYMKDKLGKSAPSTKLKQLRTSLFYGREKENLVFPIALANLFLHGIEEPNIWHGNALTGASTYAGLFEGAPSKFDIILTNPPFGGKEGVSAKNNFDFKTGLTQVLFLQKILSEISSEGTCGIVLDEGTLHKRDSAIVATKRKLLEECNLWAIVSLPPKVFAAAGANVKTNLLFFTKGKRTEKIWYYDLSHVKVGKRSPLTLAHFGFARNGEVLNDDQLPDSLTNHWREHNGQSKEPFPSYARLLPSIGTKSAESLYSWTVDLGERRKQSQAECEDMEKEVSVIRDIISLMQKDINFMRSSSSPIEGKVIARKVAEIAERRKQIREIESNMKSVSLSVFDLTAVNPNALIKVDPRSPTEIVRSIQKQESIISNSLEELSDMFLIDVVDADQE